jgi:hypothetical protein
MGLVVWIAIYIYNIEDLLHYMDSAWSYDTNPILQYYALYDTYYPSKQVRLLTLWDKIGLPHEKQKQEFGPSLMIIGLSLDPCEMSITMPATAKAELVAAVCKFINTSSSRRHALVEWQRLLGRINWAINAFPLIRPGIQSSYAKITGKSHPHATIYLNRVVIRDLLWLTNIIEESDGICMLNAVDWDTGDADLTVFCDASLSGMGFFCSSFNVGFVSPVPQTALIHTIFYYEALCVVSALLWASQLPMPPRRLLIYTDSMNAVEMFHSFKALDGYNNLLLFAVGILIHSHTSLHVFHVPRSENIVTDALSRSLLHIVEAHHPGLVIRLFQPPPEAMGVAER